VRENYQALKVCLEIAKLHTESDRALAQNSYTEEVRRRLLEAGFGLQLGECY
jgi:hypothetical protein